MERTENILCEIKKSIHDKLQYGIRHSELQDIAGAIQDIEVIERFMCECKGKMEIDGEQGWIVKMLEDELEDAEMYCKKWMETGNEAYKTIAKDELRHAEYFAKTSKEKGVDKSIVEPLLAKRSTLAAKMG